MTKCENKYHGNKMYAESYTGAIIAREINTPTHSNAQFVIVSEDLSLRGGAIAVKSEIMDKRG